MHALATPIDGYPYASDWSTFELVALPGLFDLGFAVFVASANALQGNCGGPPPPDSDDVLLLVESVKSL